MFNSKYLDEKIMKTDIAVKNALDKPRIADILVNYGYTPDKLTEGQAILDRLKTAQSSKALEYGEQYTNTEELDTKVAEVRKLYMKHRKIAMVAYKNAPSMKRALGINRELSRRLPVFLTMLRQFYGKILSDADVQAALLEFGVTLEEMQAVLPLLTDIENIKREQEACKGMAQQATWERDQILNELDSWVSDFVKIARIAFEEAPQLLEAVEIRVKSPSSTKKSKIQA